MSMMGKTMRISMMINRFRILMILGWFVAVITGCGDESINTQEGDFENALFLSYAVSKSSEPMNDISTNDLITVLSRLATIINDYIAAHPGSVTDSFPQHIDLSNPPTGVEVPTGMTGTITGDSSNFHVTANDITFANCYLDVSQNKRYNGLMTVDGIFSITNQDFVTATIGAPNLTIDYTNKTYNQTKFLSWVLGIDRSTTLPSYTITGSLSVDGNGFSFTNLAYQKTSSTALTESGKFTMAGTSFSVTESPTINSAGAWTGGTLTIQIVDSGGTVVETATVTLDNTLATFQLTDGTQFENDNWATNRLAP